MLRPLLTSAHAVLGLSAVAAGQALIRDPSGSELGLDAGWLKGSPFPDFRIPGAFLATVIAIANLLSAVGLYGHWQRGPLISLWTGVLLVVWLAIQTAIIGFRHWSQAIWWVLFPGLVLLAAIVGNRAARQVPDDQ